LWEYVIYYSYYKEVTHRLNDKTELYIQAHTFIFAQMYFISLLFHVVVACVIQQGLPIDLVNYQIQMW
jgi:hypothetical protein